MSSKTRCRLHPGLGLLGKSPDCMYKTLIPDFAVAVSKEYNIYCSRGVLDNLTCLPI